VTNQLFVVNANRTKNAPKTDRPTAVRPFLDLAIEITGTSKRELKFQVLKKTTKLGVSSNTVGGGGDGDGYKQQQRLSHTVINMWLRVANVNCAFFPFQR
jgi:hypothetical protein